MANKDSLPQMLLVAATLPEVLPVVKHFGIYMAEDKPGTVIHIPQIGADLLITGPGIASTLFHVTAALIRNQYNLTVNLGIAGSFLAEPEVGSVNLVSKDRFADLGSESADGFVPGENLRFTRMQDFPFKNGWLVPDMPFSFPKINLKTVVAITSDTVHSGPASVKKLKSLFAPAIETMEGAAFFFAAMQCHVPCLQIRAISNRVEPRDTAGWQPNLAISNLCTFFINHLHEFGK
jgi:futalosine hydrolase